MQHQSPWKHPTPRLERKQQTAAERLLKKSHSRAMETGPADSTLDRRAAELVSAVLDSARSGPPSPESRQPAHEIRNIDWASGRDFTAERGRAQIEEYMRTWEVRPGWKCSVRFVGEEALEFRRRFHYRALWSLPTRRAPVSRGTAAVHFIIETPETRSQALPVEVRFTVESSRTEHAPQRTRFRERWLEEVMESKALLLDSVDF